MFTTPITSRFNLNKIYGMKTRNYFKMLYTVLQRSLKRRQAARYFLNSIMVNL